jgi:glucokinase
MRPAMTETQARYVLAADVGGTKTIVSRARVAGGRIVRGEIERFASRDHDGLGSILADYATRHDVRGLPACFGVAGPVRDGRCVATNLPWVIEADALRDALGLGPTTLCNDFEAAAHGLDALDADQIAVLQEGVVDATAPRALLGAGTGLGEALVLPEPGGGWRVVPGEGGHADFAPRDAVQDEVLRRLRAVHGRVCWERVLSGSGLAAVYRCLRDMGGAESPAVRAALDATDDPAAVVGRFGTAGDDALCAQALDVFLDVYGTEAGNMALRHLARGGVYLAGGIAAKVMPRIARGGLLAAFRAKGRMSPIVAEVRLAVVLDPALGLLGAAARAASV